MMFLPEKSAMHNLIAASTFLLACKLKLGRKRRVNERMSGCFFFRNGLQYSGVAGYYFGYVL